MNTALFIDLNTIDISYVGAVIRDVVPDRAVLIKKAYGYIGRNRNKKGILENAGIHIVETPKSYGTRTSLELILDMIEAADDINIEEIYLVTGDAYLCPAVRRILAKGKRVVVAASSDVAAVYIPVCSRFRFLEVLDGRTCAGPFTEITDIRTCIYEILTEGKARGTAVTAEEIYHVLCNRYHEFDIANYGYTHFETFAQAIVDGIALEEKNDRLVVRLLDDRSEIERFIYAYLSERNYKIDDMDALFTAINEKFAEFDIANYGYGTEIGFLLSFPKLEIYDNKGVKLKQSFKLK